MGSTRFWASTIDGGGITAPNLAFYDLTRPPLPTTAA